MRQLLAGAALLLGLAAALSGRHGQAADSETIDRLVKQLGSGRFTEREKAQKKLEEIGLPAYDALKKAVETGDPELKRRASDLVSKLEKQVQGKKVLAPTLVKLSYKDIPLKEALADLGKKSGYRFQLLDPENKLAQRRITLETGETTFWEAFDQFCAKANLSETEAPTEVIGPLGLPQGGGVIQIQPGVIIRPNVRPLPAPIKKAVPAPAPAPVPDAKPAQKAGGLAFQAADQVAPAKPAPAAPKPAIAPAQAPVAPPVAPPVMRRRPIRLVPPPQTAELGVIVLKDGAGTPEPTSYSGAVRVKVMDNAQRFGPVGDKELLVGLKVTPEAKVRWQNTVHLRIDRAIDDQDQNLTQAMAAAAGPGQPPGQAVFPGGGGVIIIRGGVPMPFGRMPTDTMGPHQYLPVRLNKGEKPSKSLKELTGAITAQVLAEPEVHLTADDLLKAAGKTFKGKESGSLKILSVTPKDDQLSVRFEFEAPKDIVAAGQPGVGFPVGVPWNGPIQLMPVPVPVPLPAPAPALPQANQAFQVQVKVAQIQIGGGGIGFAPAFIGQSNPQGLELLDDKGNVIPSVSYGGEGRAGAGGGVEMIHTMTFKLQKDQKPARFVFKGSKSVTVEVPFKLKDIKLP